MENLFILLKWIFIYFITILLFKKFQYPFLYLIISICFLTGFLLRKFNLYPGKPEPLFLDFSTFLISLSLFFINKFVFKIDIKITLGIILFPHILYNILKILKFF